MGTTTYTDEQKARAVEIYLEAGPDEAARQVGCDRRSVYRWLHSHGVTAKSKDPERWANWQHQTELLLADQVHELIHRQNEPHVEERIGPDGITEIVHRKATAADAKGYAIAAGVMIDKLLLLRGEATSRTEISQLPNRALVHAWVEALEHDIADSR